MILCSPGANFRVLRYAWPEERSSSQVAEKNTIQTSYLSDILFDEYTSRIVIRGGRLGVEAIVDLAAA